jgi:type VI secretion system secreted protein VgrG
VTLKAPGGFIVIDGSGVTIEGAVVNINCGASAEGAKPGGGGNPEKPKEAKVEEPPAPVMDDVSRTGLGPGR